MIKLRRKEQRELRERQHVEGAIALFLDLEGYCTWEQIAEELRISTSKLRDLTKSDLFDEIYNKMFGELGHDPRYLTEFLDEVQVGNTINIILPAEYEKAMEEADIIDGELVEESVSSDVCVVAEDCETK